MQNVGPHYETWNAGVLGPITLNGLNEGRRDLSWQKWSYKVLPQTSFMLPPSLPYFLKYHSNACFLQVGLKGEALALHSVSGSSSAEWMQGYLNTQKQPLTWYKVSNLHFAQEF